MIINTGCRTDIPAFYSKWFDVKKHIQCFDKIAKKLKGYTHNCTISFLDLYEKILVDIYANIVMQMLIKV